LTNVWDWKRIYQISLDVAEILRWWGRDENAGSKSQSKDLGAEEDLWFI
jgi:hypothetical protein